nr:hypothetical protein [Tanacetum cinerariifolium]
MDTALIYDTDGISEVPNFDHYYDNVIYNLFTHEEKHLELPKYTQGTSVKQEKNRNIHFETLDMDLDREDDGISEVPNFDHYYDNVIYNLFTHEEKHLELPKYTQGTSVKQEKNRNIHFETLDMDLDREDGE